MLLLFWSFWDVPWTPISPSIHQHFFLKTDSYIYRYLLFNLVKRHLGFFVKSQRNICSSLVKISYVNEGANTSFVIVESMSNSIPKGHFWPATTQIYMSCLLWLLQARVKNVEAEDLKIKILPPHCNQKNRLLSEWCFTINSSKDFSWKQNTFRWSPYLN